VHRDLKPANVLLEEGDRGLRTKVIDFGVAALVDDAPHDHGEVHGTPAFMSPEQLRASRDIDTRTDVWALGVMLFQQLTGVLPWLPSGDRDLDAERICSRSLPAASAQWSVLGQEQPMLRSMEATRRASTERAHALAIAGDLDAICSKCLDHDPEQRYSSAAALAADLRAWLAHDPVSAVAPSMHYRARCLLRKHPRAAAGVGVAALGTLGAAIVMGVLWQQARHAEAAAVTSRDRAERTLGTFLASLRAADALSASNDAAITIPALLERIEWNAQADLAEDLDALTSVRDTVAVVYLANQDFEAARRNLEAAIAVHRQQVVAAVEETERRQANLELATSLHHLGRARWLLQDVAGSREAFSESLALRESADPDSIEAIADTMQMVSAVEERAGNLARSDDLGDQSIAMLKDAGRQGSDVHVAVLMTRANTLLRSGRTQEAMERFADVAPVLAAAGRPDDWRAGRALSQLALLQAKSGDIMGALPNYERALEISSRRFGASHQLVTSIHHRIAELMLQQGATLDRAREHAVLAIEGRRLDGRRPLDLAASLELGARIERARGDRAQSIALQRGALVVRRAANPIGDASTMVCTATLGDWLVQDGQVEAARPILLEAIERGERSAGNGPAVEAALTAARAALARCGTATNPQR